MNRRESIHKKRQKSLYNWAIKQDIKRLATLFVNTVSLNMLREICENENIKIEK